MRLVFHIFEIRLSLERNEITNGLYHYSIGIGNIKDQALSKYRMELKTGTANFIGYLDWDRDGNLTTFMRCARKS